PPPARDAEPDRLLADPCLVPQALGHQQTPLSVERHRLRLAEEHPRVRAALRVGEGEVADLDRPRRPLGPGEAEETPVLPERQDGTVGERLTEPTGQADAPLRVELIAVRAEQFGHASSPSPPPPAAFIP